MRFEELTGRTVVIWGAGREGRAALDTLAALGIEAAVAVTGGGAVPDDLAAVTVAGEAAVHRLETADVVVKSPGVPHTDPLFLRLRERGVAITSLTDLWLSENHERVVAVTGTKGKSTTSALIHHLLDAVGVPSSLVGNGGTPVTADDPGDAQIAVVEVSSYQAADLTVSPRIAVVTSLYPEHLPWHGGYEQYVADKLNLVAHGPDVVVVPDRVSVPGALVAERMGSRPLAPLDIGIEVGAAGLAWEGVGDLTAADLPLRGAHNLVNAALALTAVHAVTGSDPATAFVALNALRTFAPLAHRLEVVPSDDGRTWINDGLATAPESVVAALAAHHDDRITLIAGGADRGLSFAPLTSYLSEREGGRVKVVAVGPAGDRLAAQLTAESDLPDLRVAPDFATALAWARTDADETDVVLLSPGAPSFDEFASYEERARAFRAAAGGRG